MAESVSERELRVRRRDERRTLEELEETRKELAEMKERLAAEERRVGELLAERRQTVEMERNVEIERDTSRKKERNISSGNILLDTFGGVNSAHGALGVSIIHPGGDVKRKTVFERKSSGDDSIFPPAGEETHTDEYTVLSNLTDRRESVLRDLNRLCGDSSEFSPQIQSAMKSTPLSREQRETKEDKLKRGRQLLEKQRQQQARREEMKRLRLEVEAERKLLEEEQRLKAEREIDEEIYNVRKEFEEERQSLVRESRQRVEQTLKFERAKLQRELEERIRILEADEEQELLEEIRILRLEADQQKEKEEETLMSARLAQLRKEKEELEQKLRITRVQEQERSTFNADKPIGKPKLPEFNGSQFEEWKIEIYSLLETKVYSESSLTQVVRNSISGKARQVLLTLPPSATTRQILRKMEDLYGNIRSGDSIVYDFYAAKQEKDETCSDWGIRIETLFNKAVERGEVLESRKDVKVKERFWRGLYSEKIREATRNCFESSDSFDQLRRKARIEELERSTVKVVQEQRETETKSEAKEYVNVQSASVDTKYDTLLNKIASLETSLEMLRSESSSGRGNGSYRGRYPYNHRGDRRQDWRNNKREDNSASRWRNDKPPNKPRSESQKGDKAQNSSKAEPKKEEEKKDDTSLN